jgi:hypothetical protein
MLRIGQIEVTAQNNKYTDGNVAGGIPATRLRAAALNAFQEELAGIVEGGGLDLDPDDSGQLLKALKLLFAEKTESLGALAALVGADNKMPYFTGTDKAALTALTAFARELLAQNDAAGVLTKLGLGDLGNAAKKNVGTTAGTVAAGDDPRFDAGFGAGQTWQNVKANRASGVTYTNSSGKTIAVAISTRNGATVSTATVDAIVVSAFTPNNSGTILSSIFFLVPNGSTYAISSGASLAGTDTSWVEYR